jgi:hypothetical protein
MMEHDARLSLLEPEVFGLLFFGVFAFLQFWEFFLQFCNTWFAATDYLCTEIDNIDNMD